jgi:glutathione synthase/RimK-type ligase-like ATP-grasp enzyme
MNYRNINEVNDLYINGILKRPINEAKENKDDKKGITKKTLNPNAEHFDVHYADEIKTYTNIFKHIIIFTNDRDPKGNKTLKNIYEAVENLKKDKCPIIPELHVFVAAEMEADESEEEIRITDGDEEFVIKGESNLDTLIFARLGVQGESQCEHIVQLLQDRGFLVLNPVKYSALACDKYESAVLFKKGDIPQPNFTLMTKDILYDEKQYNKAMKSVYKEWDSKNPDNNEKLMFVVKILDGHGGTGVAMVDGKKILAIFQMVFAIDPERRLIIQKKEEADGGDIRVHVLTLRDKQVILAKMKRVKLGGDFRSNVSLGAEAESVDLTPEQEQIALKTAQLSHLPWCAVDIMPLVKGSNPKLGDNVVLEINASPGTAGISDVMEENFVNLLLNELDDPSQFMLQDKIAGYIESVTLNFGDGFKKEFLAKLDTGNSTSASHLEVGKFEDTGKTIKFSLDGKQFEFDKIDEMIARAGDKEYKRPVVVIPEMTLGLRKLKNVHMGIVESREEKSTNCLLNCDTLSKLGYVVHPNKAHILTKEMEKVKIVD